MTFFRYPSGRRFHKNLTNLSHRICSLQYFYRPILSRFDLFPSHLLLMWNYFGPIYRYISLSWLLFLKLAFELNHSALSLWTANEQHYEVPDEFYHAVLGPYLKYSSGFWKDEKTTLAESEIYMLDMYIERAGNDI